MIITVCGKPCSGKSTISRIFAEKYGFEMLDAGNLFKAEAARRGMSVAEFITYRTNDASFDFEIDKQFIPMGQDRANDNLIIDSRVAWHFIPNSFKVFIDLDENVMIERLLNSDRTGKEKYNSWEDAKTALLHRMNTDQKHYKNIYSIDIMDNNNYDLILDSSNNTPEELVNILWKEYNKFIKKHKKK